jgi:hypothetical protein
VSIITKKVTGKNNNNNGFPLQFAAHASFRTWRNSINAHLVPSRSAPLSLFPNSGQYFYFKIHSLKYQSFFFFLFQKERLHATEYRLQDGPAAGPERIGQKEAVPPRALRWGFQNE